MPTAIASLEISVSIALLISNIGRDRDGRRSIREVLTALIVIRIRAEEQLGAGP